MLLLTPGASNCSLNTVVWILIGYKSRPYLELVVTETVLKPTATSPPLEVWASWWELGIVLKVLLFLPLSISQGQVVGERASGGAVKVSWTVAAFSSGTLWERKGGDPWSMARSAPIFPPWVAPGHSTLVPEPGGPPLSAALPCPVLLPRALGCPGSAQPSSPEETLGSPRTEKPGSERQREGRRG